MTRHLLTALTIALLTTAGVSQSKTPRKNREYKSAAGDRVVIAPVGAQGESRVVFFDSDNQRMCTADYTSSDGSHGLVVAKAEWTPDGRFFVYSMTSSGGHSVMSTPTQFFSLRDQSVCLLDSYVGKLPIEFADFRSSAPNIVRVIVNGSEKPVRVRLSSVDAKATNKEHGCVPCKDGLVHDFGDKTPYEHSPN
jgi:hypothetical protein